MTYSPDNIHMYRLSMIVPMDVLRLLGPWTCIN